MFMQHRSQAVFFYLSFFYLPCEKFCLGFTVMLPLRPWERSVKALRLLPRRVLGAFNTQFSSLLSKDLLLYDEK